MEARGVSHRLATQNSRGMKFVDLLILILLY